MKMLSWQSNMLFDQLIVMNQRVNFLSNSVLNLS